MGFDERVLAELPFPKGQVPPVTKVRGTLLASSVRNVRDRGLNDAYFSFLEPELHDAIRGLVPSTWIPVDVALGHYRSIDQLDLTGADHWAMGRVVAERVQHGWAGTVIRGLKASGAVTPVQVLGRFPTAWDRLFQGGASAVVQTGPKDIRVEAYGMPMSRGVYFRNAWSGMFESTLELVARKVYVRELPNHRSDTTCAFAISWV